MTHGHDRMTESEIRTLELATKSKLPGNYRYLLQHYPAFLSSQAEEDELDEVCELYRAQSSLLEANSAENLRCFPPDCFVIGDNGCGDLFAISTTLPDAPVFMGGPHEGEYPIDTSGNPVPAYPSIYAYIASLHNDSALKEPPPEGMMERILGILGVTLFIPVILLGSVLAALTAPFFVMLLWCKRFLHRSTPARP